MKAWKWIAERCPLVRRSTMERQLADQRATHVRLIDLKNRELERSEKKLHATAKPLIDRLMKVSVSRDAHSRCLVVQTRMDPYMFLYQGQPIRDVELEYLADEIAWKLKRELLSVNFATVGVAQEERERLLGRRYY